MGNIRIAQLSAIGSELFQDTESFLQELREDEIKTIAGGVIVSQVTISVGFLKPGDFVVFKPGDEEALQNLGGAFKEWFDSWYKHSIVLSVPWAGLR